MGEALGTLKRGLGELGGLSPRASWRVLKDPEVSKGGPENVLRGFGGCEDCGRLGVGGSNEPEGLKETHGTWENLKVEAGGPSEF